MDGPKHEVQFLQKGSAAHPLELALGDTFTSGSILVKPANVTEVTATFRGETLTLAQYALALTDAAADWQSYITIENVPVRTTPGALQSGELVNLALIGEGVYLNGQTGNDESDGTTPGTAVKTWEQAVALLKQYSQTHPNPENQETGFLPTIYIVNTVDLADGQTITLPQGEVDTSLYQKYEEAQGREPQYAIDVYKRQALPTPPDVAL